jgi:branched-chain amino acid transport system ATP-binding protein
VSDCILEIKGLTKIFGGLTAINNIDLNVMRGSITAVIGPNGAGKTTVFNIIAGVIPPDKGEIIFNGNALTAPARRSGSSWVSPAPFSMFCFLRT